MKHELKIGDLDSFPKQEDIHKMFDELRFKEVKDAYHGLWWHAASLEMALQMSNQINTVLRKEIEKLAGDHVYTTRTP
jgi:hypothetical protein